MSYQSHDDYGGDLYGFNELPVFGYLLQKACYIERDNAHDNKYHKCDQNGRGAPEIGFIRNRLQNQ